MAKGLIRFHHVIQDSQEFGSDDEHMFSRVFFSIEFGGKQIDGLHADIKQPVGAAADAALEISGPKGYKGPLDYNAFQVAVESYFRSLVGPQGMGINFPANASLMRMRNNRLQRGHVAAFEAEPSGGAW